MATGRDIEREAKSRQPPVDTLAQESDRSADRTFGFAADWVLFFPEGLFAALALLASPFWAASLAYRGAYAAAGMVALTASLGVAVSVIAWQVQSKWLLYLAVLIVLFGALAGASWATQGAT